MRARVLLALTLVLAAASAFTVTAATKTPASATVSGPCGRVSTASYTHVVWIWLENRNASQVLGPTGQAPHLQAIAKQCGTATAYYAVRHPSLPNYLAAVSGSTGGVTSDCSPSKCPQRRASIFGQLGSRQWRSFVESMATRCDLSSYGNYAPKHNPAVYFTPIRSQCRNWDQPLGGSTGPFATQLKNNTLTPFTFVTPNLCNDGHNCSTATADNWLATWLGRIVSSRAYAAGHTAVFVTWDEGLDNSTNQVATVVLAPSVRPGTTSSTRYSHYSLLRTTEELLHLPLLGNAAKAASMRSMLP